MSTTPSAAEILEREIANTKRQTIVTVAAAAVAVAGAFDLIGALQLWSAVWLIGLYAYVPWALLALGAVLIFLGSRIYSQQLRAVVAAIVLVPLGVLATGGWAFVTAKDGF